MARFADDGSADAYLNDIKNSAIRITAVSQAPTVFADIATFLLAEATITGADFTGPVNNDGGGGGRMITFNGLTGVSVSNSGDATHVVLHDNVSSWWTVPITLETLTAAGQCNILSFKLRVKDPAAS